MAMKFLDLRGLQQVWSAVLAKEVALRASIDEVKNSISFSAASYTAALEYAKAENIGKIIMLSGSETDLTYAGVVYAAGPYVITGDKSISFLSTSSGDVAGDELASLKSRVTTVESSVATLQSSVGELETGVADKVDKEDGKSLVADSEIVKLASVEAGAQANVIETIKVNGAELTIADKAVNIVVPETQVSSVKVDDDILSLTNGVISSNISYTREVVDGVDALVLKGKEGKVIGSVPVADFIVDGMLKNIELQGDNLVFTFNIDVNEDGEDKKVITVDLSKYLNAYAEGEGIKIDGNVISVINPFTTEDKTKLDNTATYVNNIENIFAKKEYVDSTFVKVDGFNPFTVADKTALDKVVADVAKIDLTPFAKAEEVAATYATQEYVNNTFVKVADNPFTSDYKATLDEAISKLSNIETGAQVNKIEAVVFGETNLVDETKTVDLTKIFATNISETTKGLTVDLAISTFLLKDEVSALNESDIDSVLTPKA